MAPLKVSEVKVGVLVVVAITVFIVFLIAIRGVDWGKEYSSYWVRLKGIKGLVKGSKVRYAGIHKGSVSRIQIDPSDQTRIRVDFEVEGDIEIREDLVASVQQVTITGEHHLELEPKSNDASLVPLGGEIKAKDLADIGEVIERVEDVASRSKILLDKVIDGFDNVMDNIDPAAYHARNFTENLDRLLTDNYFDIEEIVINLRTTSRNVKDLTKQVKDQPSLILLSTPKKDKD